MQHVYASNVVDACPCCVHQQDDFLDEGTALGEGGIGKVWKHKLRHTEQRHKPVFVVVKTGLSTSPEVRHLLLSVHGRMMLSLLFLQTALASFCRQGLC